MIKSVLPSAFDKNEKKFDVFLNFSSETSQGFTKNLYEALRAKSIEAFLDDGLENEDEIEPNRLKALRDSKISVVIFSKSYASSFRCLRELVEIVECMEKNRQIVVPVFYNVSVSDVRNQQGSFRGGFDIVKIFEKSKSNDELMKWEKALAQACRPTGWDFSVFRSQSKMIDEIVGDILKKLESWDDTRNENPVKEALSQGRIMLQVPSSSDQDVDNLSKLKDPCSVEQLNKSFHGIDLVAQGDEWHVQSETIKAEKKDEEDFIPIFEDDNEQVVELWHGLVGYPEAFLPKKGDLVVYFPQGHLEYAALFPSLKESSVEEAPSFGLQPEVVCRVEHVQLIANKKNDEVCADITLLPDSEPVGMSSERKEDNDAGIDVTKVGGESYSRPASSVFFKTLEFCDAKTLSVPKQNENLFFQDYVQLGSPQEVVAWDFQRTEWMLELSLEDKTGNYCITKGWSEFVRDKHLVPGDNVVFMRDQEKKLRLGIRRAGCHEIGVPDSIIAKNYNSYNFLLPVADAIYLMSKFHVFYCTRASFVNFLIPYDKYMKSIQKAWPIKDSFQVQMSGSMQRCRGVVNRRADLDPDKWPQSSWRCLMVRWEKHTGERFKTRVSPWEIDSGVSSLSSLVGSPLHLQNASDVYVVEHAPATLYPCGVDRFKEAVETLPGVSSTKYSLPGVPYEQQEKRKPFIFSEYQNTSRSAVIEILEGVI